jgi:hypothetical protein
MVAAWFELVRLIGAALVISCGLWLLVLAGYWLLMRA